MDTSESQELDVPESKFSNSDGFCQLATKIKDEVLDIYDVEESIPEHNDMEISDQEDWKYEQPSDEDTNLSMEDYNRMSEDEQFVQDDKSSINHVVFEITESSKYIDKKYKEFNINEKYLSAAIENSMESWKDTKIWWSIDELVFELENSTGLQNISELVSHCLDSQEHYLFQKSNVSFQTLWSLKNRQDKSDNEGSNKCELAANIEKIMLLHRHKFWLVTSISEDLKKSFPAYQDLEDECFCKTIHSTMKKYEGILFREIINSNPVLWVLNSFPEEIQDSKKPESIECELAENIEKLMLIDTRKTWHVSGISDELKKINPSYQGFDEPNFYMKIHRTMKNYEGSLFRIISGSNPILWVLNSFPKELDTILNKPTYSNLKGKIETIMLLDTAKSWTTSSILEELKKINSSYKNFNDEIFFGRIQVTLNRYEGSVFKKEKESNPPLWTLKLGQKIVKKSYNFPSSSYLLKNIEKIMRVDETRPWRISSILEELKKSYPNQYLYSNNICMAIHRILKKFECKMFRKVENSNPTAWVLCSAPKNLDTSLNQPKPCELTRNIESLMLLDPTKSWLISNIAEEIKKTYSTYDHYDNPNFCMKVHRTIKKFDGTLFRKIKNSNPTLWVLSSAPKNLDLTVKDPTHSDLKDQIEQMMQLYPEKSWLVQNISDELKKNNISFQHFEYQNFYMRIHRTMKKFESIVFRKIKNSNPTLWVLNSTPEEVDAPLSEPTQLMLKKQIEKIMSVEANKPWPVGHISEELKKLNPSYQLYDYPNFYMRIHRVMKKFERLAFRRVLNSNPTLWVLNTTPEEVEPSPSDPETFIDLDTKISEFHQKYKVTLCELSLYEIKEHIERIMKADINKSWLGANLLEELTNINPAYQNFEYNQFFKKIHRTLTKFEGTLFRRVADSKPTKWVLFSSPIQAEVKLENIEVEENVVNVPLSELSVLEIKEQIYNIMLVDTTKSWLVQNISQELQTLYPSYRHFEYQPFFKKIHRALTRYEGAVFRRVFSSKPTLWVLSTAPKEFDSNLSKPIQFELKEIIEKTMLVDAKKTWLVSSISEKVRESNPFYQEYEYQNFYMRIQRTLKKYEGTLFKKVKNSNPTMWGLRTASDNVIPANNFLVNN